MGNSILEEHAASIVMMFAERKFVAMVLYLLFPRHGTVEFLKLLL
jgi:hypothetical protein